MPAWSVHSPWDSEAATSAESSALPTPRPCATAATYTLTSATPAYTQRLETGLSAAHPITRPSSSATSRQDVRCPASQSGQYGVDVMKVAFLVAIPSE